VERINRERNLIKEYELKINHYTNGAASINNTTNLVLPLDENNLLDIDMLYESEKVIINENKLLEERINLISKRCEGEKDKIYDLKHNIKLKTLQNNLNWVNSSHEHQPQQHVLAKKILDLNALSKKDLITTKL
jgi:hypothetical protein